VGNRIWRRSGGAAPSPSADQEGESLNPFISNVQELASLRLALGYNVVAERKGSSFRNSLTDLDMNLRLTPTNFLNFVFDGGVNPGAREITQGRATLTFVDPRPITRRSLDPDFLKPNTFQIGYRYLVNGPNGFLSSNANINLNQVLPGCTTADCFNEMPSPAYCANNPTDPRCPFASNPKSILGDLVGTFFYHLTDNILLNLSSTYSLSNNKLLGVRGAVKVLSPCDCWTLTLVINQTVNPAQTSFHVDFTPLGLGTQRKSTF